MASDSFDILFTGATVVDGTGAAARVADVGVLGDRVAAVGDLGGASAHQTHDLAGRALAPGFIDVHTHDDNAILRAPDCLAKISQGVTTVVVGNCGISAAPVRLHGRPPEPLNLLGDREDFPFEDFAQYVHAVGDAGPAVNVAALAGHTSLRISHVGDLARVATARESLAMQNDLERSMARGAIGLSTGLAYPNALAASTSEVVGLAKVAASAGGIYTTHLRNEFDAILDALDEAFAIGAEAGLPVVVSHLKCAGPQNWGRSAEVLAAIESSPWADRVQMDCYPYRAGSSNLDLGQVDDRIDILITRSEPHPEHATKTLARIAEEWGVSQPEAAKKLMPAGAVYFSMDEGDMRVILEHPKTMIGSDGLPSDPHPHPRLYGTFPRVLGRYCREQSLFPLEQAVRKMTGLPAETFGLAGRGKVEPGCFADLVVFDPHTVADTATFEDPHQVSAGIERVVVNGRVAYYNGRPTGSRSGRFLPNPHSS
jgi:N-acyl-D-aspartate/D-glutamate deacylase